MSDTAERHSAPASPRVLSAAARAYAYAVRSRPLTGAALVVYSVSLALLLGLWSAYRAVSGAYPFGQVQAGPWRTTPRVGSREADPYARAVVARRAEIPLAIGEGLTLTSTVDSAGRALDPACTYRIGPATPQARYWTFTLYDDDGHPVPSALQRSGFTSAEVVRDPEGGFAIVLSRDPMPGNWLRLPERGRVGVVLRLYDTPVAAGTAALDGRTLPAIERLDCAS